MTLAKHEQSLRGAKKQDRTVARRVSPGILRQQIDRVEEDYAEDEVYEEALGDAVDSASNLFRPLSEREQWLLDQMRQWGETASGRPDSKAKTLIRWLKENIKPDGEWSDERVIIFTEYRATQNWLQGLWPPRVWAAENGS